MIGCRSRHPCRKLFPNLEILLLPSQYILSLLLFMIRNKNQFQVNSEIHQINTRQHAILHQLSVNMTKYQKNSIGVKVFNMLPFYIKAESHNPKKFKAFLQNTCVKIPFIPWMNILNAKLNLVIWSELTPEGFGANVPFIYLQISIINMLVYIQPLSVTKGNFLLKEYL